MQNRHLHGCPENFAELADVILVAGDTRFPAHSHYLAAQSRVVREMLLDTNPVSWRNPLVLDSVLQPHSVATVSALLQGAYHQGAVSAQLQSSREAWDLYRLADCLDCPVILQQCKEYMNDNSAAALLQESPTACLQWFVIADEQQLEGLKSKCADVIAGNWSELSESADALHLAPENLRYIMDKMAGYYSKQYQQTMAKVKGVLQKRHNLRGDGYKDRNLYKSEMNFFCDEIDCKGHKIETTICNEKRNESASAHGTYHCLKGPWKERISGEVWMVYPESVQKMKKTLE